MDYTLIIISIAEFNRFFKSNYPDGNTVRLRYDEGEYVYDWLVSEAFQRILIAQNSRGRVYNHFKHDIYNCVYDVYGYLIQNILNRKITEHKLVFSNAELVKLIVAGDNLIIARGMFCNG